MAEVKILTPAKGFQPIKVELTITSQRELTGFQQLYRQLRIKQEAVIWEPDRLDVNSNQYYANDVIYLLSRVLTEKF